MRTLDKYNGPIDGNLQSEATTKAISDWQKGHGSSRRQADAAGGAAAQRRGRQGADQAHRSLDPDGRGADAVRRTSNADALKALQARLAERRKAAEPKAEAATQSLIRDLKAYVAADGKGVAGEQFAGLRQMVRRQQGGRPHGRRDRAGDRRLRRRQGRRRGGERGAARDQAGRQQPSQCLVFAWVEGNPRKNTQAFSCDDVAGVEKWKTDQALKSAWR